MILMSILRDFESDWPYIVVSGVDFTGSGRQRGTREKIGRKLPVSASDHPNPEFIMVNPQRKFHGWLS